MQEIKKRGKIHNEVSLMRAFILIMLIITMMSSAAQAEKRILINLASRTLALYDGNERLELYPLGVGKYSTPTPVGYYKILNKEIDPPWIDPSNPEFEVPSGANNPLGYRWMQIHGNYGIHGTNRPDSIGYYVSNGCIRMREADVEDLFDKVEIGTPVEITYNRVVVEKSSDDRIAYYIYPDGYDRQALDVKYVNSWLEPWGISAFAESNEIAEAIKLSNGEPVYIGKAYALEIEGKEVPATTQNGRYFDAKAVERGGITYLPAVPIAIALEMKLEWRHHTTLATKYGEVPGIEKKGQLYINEDDANILFRAEGWKEGRLYKLKSLGDEPVTYGEDNPPIKEDNINKVNTGEEPAVDNNNINDNNDSDETPLNNNEQTDDKSMTDNKNADTDSNAENNDKTNLNNEVNVDNETNINDTSKTDDNKNNETKSSNKNKKSKK